MGMIDAAIKDELAREGRTFDKRHKELVGRLDALLAAQGTQNALLERIAVALEAGR